MEYLPEETSDGIQDPFALPDHMQGTPDTFAQPDHVMDESVQEPFDETLEETEVMDDTPTKFLMGVIVVNSLALLGLLTIATVGAVHDEGPDGGRQEERMGMTVTDYGLTDGTSGAVPGPTSIPRATCPRSCCCQQCLGLCWSPEPEQELLPLPPPSPRPERKTKAYTLICVFEFIRQLRNTTIACTDYVYVGVAYLAEESTTGPLVFSGNVSGIKKGTLGHTNREILEDYTNEYIKQFKQRHSSATWYLGMWGSAFYRIWDQNPDMSSIQIGLYNYFNGVMQTKGWNTNDFDGFAVICLPGSSRVAYPLQLKGILPSGWKLLHTVYYSPEKPGARLSQAVVHLREADVAGFSFQNDLGEIQKKFNWETDVYNLYRMIPGFNTHYTTQLILDGPSSPDVFYEKFWAERREIFRNLEREIGKSICVSLSTAIYIVNNNIMGFYANFESYNITRRVDRPALRGEVVFNRYKLIQFPDHGAGYLWQNKTHTLFAFNQYTLKSYVKNLLLQIPETKCIVLEDIGEDSAELGFPKYQFPITVSIRKDMYLTVISEALEEKYGRV